jgi:hypothetical protein
MNSLTDRLLAIVALLCAVCLVSAFLNLWLLFGTMAWLLITVCIAFGLGRASGDRVILSTLAFIFLAYTALLFAMLQLHDGTGDPIMVLGMPVGAALVIYGIWPLGILPSLLYAILFDRWIMPSDKLERFLAEFGRRGHKT